jgi:hypothetical protein
MTSEDSITITLTKDEALVLLEMSGDFRDRSHNPAVLPLRDQAERRALWNLACVLEKSVPEVFGRKYRELVEMARKNLSH